MGSLSQTAARLLRHRGPTTPPRIGAARPDDLEAIDALLAPHVAADRMLPRSAGADAFLVARADRSVIGAVALTPWTDTVVELGSLVVARPGLGLGARLVHAAERRAAAAGFHHVVALTSSPTFFVRCGFVASRQSPSARAQDQLRAALSTGPQDPVPGDPMPRAIDAKARRCAACPRLPRCSQVMLVRPIARVEAA